MKRFWKITAPHFLEINFRLFSDAVYSAADNQDFPCLSLSDCVEDAHAVLNGLSVVTLLMASNQFNRGNDMELSDETLEQLHGLTRVTLSLSVDKLEQTADGLHQSASLRIAQD